MTKDYIAGELDNIGFVSIGAKYNGKWVLCFHKRRQSWEMPGGHVEQGELPLAAAKRELYEETGAIDFDIRPLWDYEVYLEDGRKHNNGRVYIADIRSFDALYDNSEMKEIDFFDSLPDNVTYNRDEMIEMCQRIEKYASAYYV